MQRKSPAFTVVAVLTLPASLAEQGFSGAVAGRLTDPAALRRPNFSR